MAPPLNLCGVISESKRIMKAHSRHFLALSVIFLLPLSFSILAFPTLLSLSHNSPSQTLLRSTPPQPISTNTLLYPLLYIIIFTLFFLSAVGTITSSVFHAFYGRPVKLLPTLLSLSKSLLPLLLTSYSIQIVLLIIFLLLGSLAFLLIRGVQFLGFQIDYSSPYFVGFCVVGSGFYLLISVYLLVNWGLANVVVVLESSWGFKALRRSERLVRGMRRVFLSLLLLFGVLTVALACSSLVPALGLCGSGSGTGWKSWAFLVHTVATSSFMTMLMLHSIAANTVSYMYCKAMHGELAGEIAEEFAWDYFSLPLDEEKVPRLVSVVHAR